MAPPHCTTPCGAYKTKVDKHVLARMSHLQKATGRCRTIQILPCMNSGLSPPKKYTLLLGVSAHNRTPAHAPPPAPRRCEGPDADRRKGWGGGSRDGGCRGEGGADGTVSFIYRFTFCVFCASVLSWNSVSLECHHPGQRSSTPSLPGALGPKSAGQRTVA